MLLVRLHKKACHLFICIHILFVMYCCFPLSIPWLCHFRGFYPPNNTTTCTTCIESISCCLSLVLMCWWFGLHQWLRQKISRKCHKCLLWNKQSSYNHEPCPLYFSYFIAINLLFPLSASSPLWMVLPSSLCINCRKYSKAFNCW